MEFRSTIFERIRDRFSRLVGRVMPSDRTSSQPPTPAPIRDTVIEPDEEVLVAEETTVLLPAKVILYNDEIHTFDEVISQLVKATGCSFSEAEALAVEVDTRGLAAVYEGEMDRCLRVSSILEEIALHTTVEF